MQAEAFPMRCPFSWQEPFRRPDFLPRDPRHWTREDVAKWVQFVTKQNGLPNVDVSRFIMNGKALCLMTPTMFLNRVPIGGKLLYKDFQLRLRAAMYKIEF